MFNNIYAGKRVLVTGHAGFKGSWLCLWLKKLGAEVIGYGHPPNTEPNHYELLGNIKNIIMDYVSLKENHCVFRPHDDLLNMDHLGDVMKAGNPDLVIHLAAKAIVARTFDEPRETFENNVMGAVNILEACRQTPSVKGIVMITTDKVYEDQNWMWGYREGDSLGGKDPYSASKVCIEQVIRCYRESFGMNIATARAGNVIGGGDWSYKRLIPDIVRAASKGEKVVISSPNATRPWQHILEPLSAYLLLGQKILQGEDVNDSFNIGPEGEMSVLDVLKTAQGVWPAVQWEVNEAETHRFMVYLLKIDSTKIKKLGWKPVWNMGHAVRMAILWYRVYYETGHILSNEDIRDYESSKEEQDD